MKKTICFFVPDEIKEKVQKMNDAGINVSQILRNFLLDFPFETNND